MRGVLLASSFAALAIAGCGGDDSSSTSSATPSTASTRGAATSTTTTGSTAAGQTTSGLTDAQGVRAALEAALASSDPSQACGTYVTDRYLQDAYGGRQGCLRAQQPGSAARSLGSLAAKVQGDRATASAVPSGGPYDGSKVTADLVKDAGTWKVDALHANVPVGP